MSNIVLIKKLKQELKTLESLIENENYKSLYEKEEMTYSYDTIREILESQEHTTTIESLETCNLLELVIEEYALNQEYEYILPHFESLLQESVLVNPKVDKLYLEDEKVYKILTEIISFIMGEEQFKLNNININLAKHNKRTETANYTVYIPTFKEAYVFVERTDFIQTIASLAHECGHAIELMSNFSSKGIEENFVHSETVSTTFELLSLYYLSKYSSYKNEALNFLRQIWNTFYIDVNHCMLESKFLNSLNITDIDKMNLPYFREKIREVMKDSPFKCNYQKLLRPNIYTQTRYILGFLIAIEVINLYIEDENLGRDTLKGLINLSWNQDKNEYLNHILNDLKLIPGEHLEEYKGLLEKMKVKTLQVAHKHL